MQLRKIKMSQVEQAQVYKIACTCMRKGIKEDNFKQNLISLNDLNFLKWISYCLHLNLQYFFSPFFLFTQIITFAIFPLEIRLKYAYNMGISSTLWTTANHCQMPQWKRDTEKPKIPPDPFVTPLFCLLLDETAVAWYSFTCAHSLVKAWKGTGSWGSYQRCRLCVSSKTGSQQPSWDIILLTLQM